jgi:hypothetical protein
MVDGTLVAGKFRSYLLRNASPFSSSSPHTHTKHNTQPTAHLSNSRSPPAKHTYILCRLRSPKSYFASSPSTFPSIYGAETSPSSPRAHVASADQRFTTKLPHTPTNTTAIVIPCGLVVVVIIGVLVYLHLKKKLEVSLPFHAAAESRLRSPPHQCPRSTSPTDRDIHCNNTRTTQRRTH